MRDLTIYDIKSLFGPHIDELEEGLLYKFLNLCEYLKKLDTVVLAYSGGVDSTTLLGVAQKVMPSKVFPVLVVSPTISDDEIESARKQAKEIGVDLYEIERNELAHQEFVVNHEERCYVCKKGRFEELVEWAKIRQISHVIEGSNIDDMSDYRPGMKALREISEVHSPLQEVGLRKEEIRKIAKALDLSVWNKPSSPCLVTRIPYGTMITEERIILIGKGESIVRDYLKYPFRLRDHDSIGRIEIDEREWAILGDSKVRKALVDRLRQLGFEYISIDLEPFKSGRMNRSIEGYEE